MRSSVKDGEFICDDNNPATLLGHRVESLVSGERYMNSLEILALGPQLRRCWQLYSAHVIISSQLHNNQLWTIQIGYRQNGRWETVLELGGDPGFRPWIEALLTITFSICDKRRYNCTMANY